MKPRVLMTAGKYRLVVSGHHARFFTIEQVDGQDALGVRCWARSDLNGCSQAKHIIEAFGQGLITRERRMRTRREKK